MNSPQSLAHRVVSLLSSPHLRNSLGISAQRKALLYDQSVTLPRLTNLIETIAQ